MKVTLNQIISNNYYIPAVHQAKINSAQKIQENEVSFAPIPLGPQHFPNISFGMKPDMKFLLSYSDRLKCAYSGLPMIHPDYAKSIYAKLQRRVTAQQAVHFLQPLLKYMHPIEGIVFEMIKSAPHKNKRNFRSILQEFQPASLKRLKETQAEILNSANNIIDSISNPETAKKIKEVRDESLSKIENDSFTRHFPLDKIRKIKAKGEDYQKLAQIYYHWYKLPTSHKDIDAFIVKYAKESHENIAKRLISSSVATIEHVKPSSRGGQDCLSNYILVSAAYNSSRSSTPLWEYVMLNPELDIQKHLQEYINDVIQEIQEKKNDFSKRSWYPGKIKKTIERETKSTIKIYTRNLYLTKKQKRNNSYIEKLKQVYKCSND